MRVTSLLRVAPIAMTIGLSGCLSTQVREEIDKHDEKAHAALDRPAVTQAPVAVKTQDRLYIPVRRVTVAANRSAWLSSRVVNVNLDNPVPLNTALRVVSEEGVNIVSDLPLDGYTWSGRINRADVETALRMILGGVGLDYDVDDARRLVTVRPVRSRSWVLNIGNRSTSFSSGGMNSNSLTQNDTNITSAGSNGGMNYRAQQNLAGSLNSQNGTRITTEDNFWKSLRDELDNRLQVRLPGTGNASAAAPLATTARPSAASSSHDDKTWVGTYAVNPETGSVSVSAPHWILDDLDKYFGRVLAMYNAEITFKGELLMVTRKRSDSEGLDISSFANFAKGRYGAVISNNALGGVTLSLPSGASNLPSVTAASKSVGGALIGIASPADSLQVFNAWLSEVGRVSVVQEPVITTTSGVPGEFSKKDTTYFNLVSQETSSSTSTSSTATQNTLQSKSFGTQLTINPRYDYSSGLIRAQIALYHVLPKGSLEINQTINVGDSFRTVPTTIPLDTTLAYSGEAILRDGDLIVVGGQNEQSRSLNENGLPGNKGTISGIFGSKNAVRDETTYFFALRVSIKAR